MLTANWQVISQASGSTAPVTAAGSTVCGGRNGDAPPSLVSEMSWFSGNRAGRFDQLHQVMGHLFSGRVVPLVTKTPCAPTERGGIFLGRLLRTVLADLLSLGLITFVLSALKDLEL